MNTVKFARKNGFEFTGIYQSLIDETIQKKLVIIRSQGFKAILVNENPGYSIYAEPAYRIAKEERQAWERNEANLVSLPKKILDLEAQIENLKILLENAKDASRLIPEPREIF